MYLKNEQANAQKNISPKYEATVTDLIEYLKQSSARKSEDERKLSSTMEKLTSSLAKVDKSEHEEKVLAALEKLTTSLVGDGDYTVIGQMKTLRLEMRDSNDKIISALQDFYKIWAENNQKLADIQSEMQASNEKILQEFQEFGKTLAENNSKAFIEALNETMKDFNQKLTEQFGENFKQLNVAVGRLLDWQINYIKTVETATQNLETAFEGIDAAKNSLAQISNSSSAIQDSALNIQNLIVTANIYEQKLEQVLVEVETLGDSAKNSVPHIINFIETSCNEIEKSSKTAAQNVDDLSKRIQFETTQAQNNLVNLVKTSCNEIQKNTGIAIDSVDELTEKIYSEATQAENNLVNLSKTSCDEISKTTATAANNVNNISEKVTAAIVKVQEYAEIISDISSDSVSELENFANQAVKSMSEVSKKIETTSYKQREIMDAEVKSAKDYVQKIIANLNNENARVTKTISDSLNNMMKTNNENLKKSTENLNNNLEKVLKESLEKFGDTMYKVSAKFVNDYTPLTQKLANLINIAKDVERRAYR